MNRHVLALYDMIMDELDRQDLTDTQVDINFLPRKSFINQVIRITVRNWDNGRNVSYVIRYEELLELRENINIVKDILKHLVRMVSDTKQDRMHKEIIRRYDL